MLDVPVRSATSYLCPSCLLPACEFLWQPCSTCLEERTQFVVLRSQSDLKFAHDVNEWSAIRVNLHLGKPVGSAGSPCRAGRALRVNRRPSFYSLWCACVTNICERLRLRTVFRVDRGQMGTMADMDAWHQHQREYEAFHFLCYILCHLRYVLRKYDVEATRI